MEPTSSSVGLTIIAILYLSIGGMSVAGSIYLSRLIFSARAEQIFFGLFLVAIAGFYLAFTAHFGEDEAWRLEAIAVAVFSIFGVLGTRISFFLISGYVLHGTWDMIHEYNMFIGNDQLGSLKITSVPLAYGYFCLAYDFIIAIYFYSRREDWSGAWAEIKASK